MPRKREEKEKHNHSSTACGLLFFILFFLGGFIAFIVAEDTGKYYNYAILLGSAMLCAALVVVCGILNETKNIQNLKPEGSNEPQPEQGLLLQPQPRPEISSQTIPHWIEKTRFDFAYVRQVLGIPPTDSYENTSSENDSDPDILELEKLAKYGLPANSEEPVAGTSKEAQSKSTTESEGAVDFQMDSTKAGSSKVASKSSEDAQSSPEYLPLKDMSALSLSDSSKRKAASEEKKADITAALSQMCLDSSDNEAAKLGGYDSFSTDSESKSDDQHIEDDISSTLETKKEA